MRGLESLTNSYYSQRGARLASFYRQYADREEPHPHGNARLYVRGVIKPDRQRAIHEAKTHFWERYPRCVNKSMKRELIIKLAQTRPEPIIIRSITVLVSTAGRKFMRGNADAFTNVCCLPVLASRNIMGVGHYSRGQ